MFYHIYLFCKILQVHKVFIPCDVITDINSYIVMILNSGSSVVYWSGSDLSPGV